MRTSFFTGKMFAFTALALAPVVNAQVQPPHAIRLTAHRRGIGVLADGYVYNNTDNYAGSIFTPQGAVAGTSPVTKLVADDITFLPGFGGQLITRIDFSLYNGNATPVAAFPDFSFWFADGTGGVPGTYFNFANPTGPFGFYFDFPPTDPIPVGISLWYTTISYDPSFPNDPLPKVPTNGKMWVGMAFDNNKNQSGYATPAQLNNLGVAVFSPADVGTSADGLFLTTNPGDFYNVSNPAGGVITFGHATDSTKPAANMYWGFSVTGHTLSGTVTLEGVSNPNNIDLTLDFKVGGVSKFTRLVTLDAAGAYSVDVVPGTYDVTFKTAKTLGKKVVGVNLSTSDNTASVPLKTGDATNDNAVDISDLLVLIGAYNKLAANNDGYLEAADFNGDGANDISDLLLIIGNYNQLGDS